MSEKDIEIENKKKIVEQNIDKKFNLVANLNTEKANYDNLIKKEKTSKSELQSTISELDSTKAVKSEADSNFYNIETSRNKLLKELEEIKIKSDESSIKIAEYNEKINYYETEYRIKESKLKFLVETEREKEGYNKSVKSILNLSEKDASFKKGMHGVLANLISVPKEYEIAIEMSLGGAIQNIVTDTEEEAKRFVNYLKDNKLGRASFFPISSVKGQKLLKYNDTGISGVYGIASDLIKFDKKYEQIIFNLLRKNNYCGQYRCSSKFS